MFPSVVWFSLILLLLWLQHALLLLLFFRDPFFDTPLSRGILYAMCFAAVAHHIYMVAFYLGLILRIKYSSIHIWYGMPYMIAPRCCVYVPPFHVLALRCCTLLEAVAYLRPLVCWLCCCCVGATISFLSVYFWLRAAGRVHCTRWLCYSCAIISHLFACYHCYLGSFSRGIIPVLCSALQ